MAAFGITRCTLGKSTVHNVPLAGALVTAEILYGSIAIPVVLPALACSWIATAAAWLYLPDHAAYVDIPAYHFTITLLFWALVVGPVVGLVAAAYGRLI